MLKHSVLFVFLFCTQLVFAQSINGVYTGTELRDHRIDSLGRVNFYCRYQKNYWFFDVRVSINGDQIIVKKHYAYTDSLGKKFQGDSVLHEFFYTGKLMKMGDRYIAKIQLINQPALHPFKSGKTAMSEKTAPTGGAWQDKEVGYAGELKKYYDGRYSVFKEMIRQDLIIQSDKDGIWINNKFYKKIL